MAVLTVAIYALSAAMCAIPGVRRAAMAGLARAIGASGEAEAVAPVLGFGSAVGEVDPEEMCRDEVGRFRSVFLDDDALGLLHAMWADESQGDADVRPSLHTLLESGSGGLDAGEAPPPDFYVVYACSDDPHKRLRSLAAFAHAFAVEHGRPPRVWLDALCADVMSNQRDELARMPVRVGRASKLLVVAGPRVFESMWCLAECYSWFFTGGDLADVEVCPLAGQTPEDEDELVAAADAFHVMYCSAADEGVAESIVLAVELGTVVRFNVAMRSLLPRVRAGLEAQAAG